MKRERIPAYIKFPKTQNAGGPSTFLGNFQSFLEKQAYETVAAPSEADIIFFPVRFNRKQLRALKSRGGAVIQRLDGIFFRKENLERNKVIKNIYSLYSDFVIFQSDFCRRAVFEVFGEKAPGKYELILNGADTSRFYPSETLPSLEEDQTIRFITTGNFKHLDMLEPMVLALDALAERFPICLTIVGPVTRSPFFDPTPILARPYVEHLDYQPLDEIARLLRRSHIYLHTCLNSPCPNAVIEAISTGLPVVAYHTGSMPELVSFAQELLAPVNSKNLFHAYTEVTPEALRSKIELCIGDYPKYVELFRQNSKIYDFETQCGPKYLEVLLNWKKKTPLPAESFTRRLKRWVIR